MRFHASFINGVLFAFASITIISCEKSPVNRYSIGHFPATPVNLAEFNTEFDDYNADIPVLGETFPFCFSSNRNSYGTHFDIVYKLMSVYFSKESGELDIFEPISTTLDVYIENQNIRRALAKINSPFDEFGPCLIPMGKNLYSSNSGGNQDIFFTQNLEVENYENPISIDFLNSAFDDAYPTFNHDTSEIYFTSNREGKFDIYKTRNSMNQGIIEFLAAKNSFTVEMDSILSSAFDDKCPSITDTILVFTSNRAGGFGGYDLYYSYFENGSWSAPVNFGDEINTEYDEYRPIVRSYTWQFDNDMMIFSSDRPGGKGGFDLYYVGIQRKEEN